jgi:hypothetical protein
VDGRQWERSQRDLQIYYAPLDWAEGLSFFQKGRGYICSRTTGGRTVTPWLCSWCEHKLLIRVIWPPPLMSGGGSLYH